MGPRPQRRRKNFFLRERQGKGNLHNRDGYARTYNQKKFNFQKTI